MIEVKIPGKLFVAGEYAVVNPGHKAVLISVDKFITVRIKKSNNKGSIKSYSNIKMIWSRTGDDIVLEQKDDRFEYIFSAMNIVERYIKELDIEPELYDIEVLSDLESEDGIKFGLGSSAAVTVAIVKALLEFYNVNYNKLDLFKLAVLANISISTTGSCGDIASAVYNGLILYRSFSRDAIKAKLDKERITEIIKSNWDNLKIQNITLNDKFNFLVGWTKSPASSNLLVRNAASNINRARDFYNNFLKKSDEYVDKFVSSYKNSDFTGLKEAIKNNRLLLNEYAKNFNIIIENNNLKSLIELAIDEGLAAKSSGAGGGDCGIAIYENDKNTNRIIEKWEDADISILDLNIYLGD